MSVTVRQVVRAVSREFGISVEDLMGGSKCERVATPRMLVYYLAHVEFSHGPSHIARVMDGRDHSTVARGVESVCRKMRVDVGLANSVDKIKRRLWETRNEEVMPVMHI